MVDHVSGEMVMFMKGVLQYVLVRTICVHENVCKYMIVHVSVYVYVSVCRYVNVLVCMCVE